MSIFFKLMSLKFNEAEFLILSVVLLFVSEIFILENYRSAMKATSFATRVKCGLVLMIFMLIPIFPITSTIGLFVVIFRPNWFKQLVNCVYADKSEN
jgi:hypothetical protein